MEEPHHQLQELQIIVKDSKKENSPKHLNVSQDSADPPVSNRRRWLRAAIYTFFLLAGQSVATLLGRLYYAKGGNSKWLASLVQVSGFPILLPLFLIVRPKHIARDGTRADTPSLLLISSIYATLGILVAGLCFLFSIGLQYLPVSTFSLICATQLAFIAFFSFVLNSQKLTPFIINSLVLLSISSTILVLQKDDSDGSSANKTSKGKYIIGFLCTIGGSAAAAFLMSLTQLFFEKVLRRRDFAVILHVMTFPAIVASCAVMVGLFASGEWKELNAEMEGFKLGKLSYVMILACIAVCWQVFSIGANGLILEVSSLFCNVISTFGLPIVPIFAAIFFHEKMTGVKVVSMLLAIWGFVSYVYQHYLDDAKAKAENQKLVNHQVSETPSNTLHQK